MNALNVGRIKLGAGNLDGQRRVISGSIDYANNRVQFKQPISNVASPPSKLDPDGILQPAKVAPTIEADTEFAFQKNGLAAFNTPL